jgi:peptide/nickel transport system permease protein
MIWIVRSLSNTSTGRLGLLLVGLGGCVALAGPLVAPYSPYALKGAPLESPSSEFLFGTDQLGRDVLSRLLSGGGSVLALAVLAVLVTFALGVPLALLAGYLGGKFDAALSRAADVIMSLPPLVLVLILVIILGTSSASIVLLTGLVTVPRIYRVLRGATQSLTAQDFVLAARARGEGTTAILTREVLPNITGPLLAEAGTRLNYSIIFIATLNFLGLGVQPPSSDWGLMVSEGRVYLGQAPLIAIAPACAIAVLTIGINLVSDQLSTYLSRIGQSGSGV